MNPKMGIRFPPGAINLSPAWHEQAKDGLTDAVKPSVTLCGGSGVSKGTPESCQCWVKDSGRIAAIMSAVLSVVQPDLYALNRECLLRLSEREDLREFIALWGFTFNAVSVISNRSSPAHRDGRSGGAQYSDVLVSLGGDAGTVLELYSLGIRC
ncbi:hypothetical protein BC826DRAFT_1111483 [Russula brevipes]|nr:hypothetical protein BC826DRAFT_1111483 [Russula brevipes]